MAIGQDTPHLGQHDFSLHNDWFNSRWSWVLPSHQSFMVSMLFSSASVHAMKGSLDEITHALLGGDFAGLFADLQGGWDAPVRWMSDDDFAEPDEGQTTEQLRAAAVEHRALCEGMLRAAGAPVPTTLRELAEAMITLGIASHNDGHWSMPELLPRPEDTLVMPAEMDADFRMRRRMDVLTPLANAVLRHLADDLGYPEEVFTSLDRLSRATQLDTAELQSALDHLVQEGEAQLYRGNPRIPVQARNLEGHTRFHLVPDWDTYAEEYRLVHVD